MREVIVIGLGSMGKRRIRLIRKHDDGIKIIGVDINEERRRICEKEYEIDTFANLNEVKDIINFDCAFICTAPLSHHAIITMCLELRLNVFFRIEFS